MKIIQVVGYSGSGKTTFICRLCPQIRDLGRVAIIKHMGHHTFRLEEGKDTTLHYNTGVELSVGVDDRKSVISLRTTDLDEILDLLSDRGIEYVVIEGFKTYPFPAVVIGDLESDQCVLRNPSADEVISSIDQFDDYYTISGLIKELRNSCGTGRETVLSFSMALSAEFCEQPEQVEMILSAARKKMESAEGVSGARLLQGRGACQTRCRVIYAVIAADSYEQAREALSEAVSYVRDNLWAPDAMESMNQPPSHL